MSKKILFLLTLITIICIYNTLNQETLKLYAQQQTTTHQGFSYQITDWWNYDYLSRKPLNINTTTTTTPINYQILINLTYDTDMKSNFDDIRIISYSDNTTELSYWIEHKNNSNWCHLWIKIPENIISINKTHAWIYYNNPTVNTQSNGISTFDFFDDFSTDLSQWTIHQNQGEYPKIDNGSLLCGGGTTTSPYGITIIGTNASYTNFTNGIIEADIYPSANALPEITFRGNYTNNTGYKGRWDCRTGNEPPWFKPPYNAWAQFGTSIPRFGHPNQWQEIRLIINNTNFKIYSDNILYSQVNDTDYTSAGEITLMNHYGSYTRYDNIRIRKYASETPQIYLGSEQEA